MLTVRQIDGRTWATPLTAHPPATVGTARLKKVHYRGMYNNEGIGGFEFWQTKSWLPVMLLQQRAAEDGRRRRSRWKTWMVDDPVHWDGMREAVSDLPDGRILIAGLGLGLMLHHMAAQARFTKITVVEMNPDVVQLIGPTLPPDDRVQIVVGDFYKYVARGPSGGTHAHDAVLWDLAVGTPAETFIDLLKAEAFVRLFMDVPVVRFGIRRTQSPSTLKMLAAALDRC